MVNYTAITFFELAAVFILGMLIEAVLLQVSCALFNLLAGASGKPPARPVPRPTQDEPGLALARDAESITTSPGVPKPSLEQAILEPDFERVEEEKLVIYPGVPRPGLDRAMRIVFVVALINLSATFIVLRLLRLVGQASGIADPGHLPFHLVSSPLYFLVLSAMNALMLPTRFGKGLLVALIFLFLSLALVMVLFACLVIAQSAGLRLPQLP